MIVDSPRRREQLPAVAQRLRGFDTASFTEIDLACLPDMLKVDRLLVTSPFGRTLPLIRYELTDIPVPDDRPCSCGAHSPLVGDVKGRPER